MSSEDRHIVVSDGGRGADSHGSPPPPQPKPFLPQAQIATTGLDWSRIEPVVARYGDDVVHAAVALHRAGFSATWIHELIDQVKVLGPSVIKSILDHWPIPKG